MLLGLHRHIGIDKRMVDTVLVHLPASKNALPYTGLSSKTYTYLRRGDVENNINLRVEGQVWKKLWMKVFTLSHV